MARILIAGESWTDFQVHIKGFDFFSHSSYGEGVAWLRSALESSGHAVHFMPSHVANAEFPSILDLLRGYDVVILSDIGSNTLILHPDTFPGCKRSPNRSVLVRDYVRGGGSLMMIGGYMSFAGFQGAARWAGTAVEEALPVTIDRFDDREEMPGGITPRVVQADHPIVAGLPVEWPYLLGYNKVHLRPEAHLVVAVGDDPLVAAWEFGEGRAMVFTSDCSPHWGPPEFCDWPGYAPLWANAVAWLTG